MTETVCPQCRLMPAQIDAGQHPPLNLGDPYLAGRTTLQALMPFYLSRDANRLAVQHRLHELVGAEVHLFTSDATLDGWTMRPEDRYQLRNVIVSGEVDLDRLAEAEAGWAKALHVVLRESLGSNGDWTRRPMPGAGWVKRPTPVPSHRHDWRPGGCASWHCRCTSTIWNADRQPPGVVRQQSLVFGGVS